MPDYISKLGVELEGGWSREIGSEIYGDGSVTIDTPCDYQGEIASRPSSLDEILSFIDINYPDHSNRTCGMHVHVSFNNKLTYMKMMEKTFYDDWFLPSMKTWGVENLTDPDHEFWKRLNGENHYCKKRFNPKHQCRSTDHYNDARYTQLNYCYARYKTMECRMFPIFGDKRTAISAVKCFHDTINNYIESDTIHYRDRMHNINIETDIEVNEESICV